MKKFLLLMALPLVAFCASAQTSTLKPAIKNDKASFTTSGKTSTTVFQLMATDTEMDDLKKHAATMGNIKLTAAKQKGGMYDCKLVINDRNDAMYVQRIFSFFGFSDFMMDGTQKSVTELGTTLANLK